MSSLLRKGSKSKASKEEPPTLPPKDSGGKLFALLLNTATKDEGEEFLDYSYPAESPELQAILPMKGVFLASRGVVEAAVGQEVKFLVFRSLDGRQEYKVSIRPLERWLLCVVLPAATTDAASDFFVEEAVALVGLRHGRLESLQGSFRQLEPIFRALAGLFRASQVGLSPLAGAGGAKRSDAGLLYMSLGIVLWHSLADDWREVVKLRIAEWERGWSATAPQPPLAQPQGFAIFLDSALMATSLDSTMFTACLRLLALEGVLVDLGAASSPQASGGAMDGGDVRCHSLFLPDSDSGAVAALPSHQYSLLQKGPWLLFILWNMACNSPSPAVSSPPAASKAGTSDPFGVDLSLDLLGSLPLPPEYSAKGAAAAGKASPLSVGSASSRSGGRTPAGEKSKRGFGLPCSGSIFKHSARGKAEESGVKEAMTPSRPASFFYALDLQGTGAKLKPAAPSSFSNFQEPSQACKPKLLEAAGICCPVLAAQARRRSCLDWSAAEAGDFMATWSDLDWLSRSHAARRASWAAGPSRAAKRNVLIDILRGDNALDKIWDECLAGSTLGEDLEQEQDDAKKKMKTEATLLGSGEAWRFQEGAPYLLSDIPPLISAGSLVPAGQSKSWLALSATASGASAIAPAAGLQNLIRARSSSDISDSQLPGNRSLLAMAAEDPLPNPSVSIASH